MNHCDPATTRLPILPEFEPAADLWSRIERRHVRRQRRRRLVAVGSIAAVFVAAIAVFAFQATTRDSNILAEQRRETMQLEQDWQALGAVTGDNGYTRLRSFDVALQEAYDRRVENHELDVLWGERNQVLRDLIQARRDATASAPDHGLLISI